MTCARYHHEKYRLWTDEQGRPIAVEEITLRTIRGQRIIVPTAKNNAMIVGIFAKAQEKYDFELFATSWLTNHGSYVIGTRDAVHRAKIMRFVHSKLATELGAHGDFGVHSRGGKRPIKGGRIWGRRGTLIQAITDADAVDRLSYALSNGPKEGLCRSPMSAVGVNSGRALYLGDRVMHGAYVDRTRLAALRKQRGKDVPESEATTQYALKLAKLPHLRHLDDDAYRDFARGVCHDIVAQAQALHGVGFTPPSAHSLRNQDPRFVPDEVARSPAPRVHCHDVALRAEYKADYRAFVEAYQIAHHELKASLREGRPFRGEFPPGCIRPTDLLGD